MAHLPTILVAGDENLYMDLASHFPTGSCRLFFCETFAETLDRAAEAAVVVIEDQITGGGEDLCRRLRSDPITASVPLLLRSQHGPAQTSQADQVISRDMQQTVDALYAWCPELADSSLLPTDPDDLVDDETFDLDESTMVWRRPEGVDDWPPAPPEMADGDDHVSFLRGYSGYVNSLVEGLGSPGSLTPAQRTKLDDMAQLTLDNVDLTLAHAQRAVNDALRDGDLKRMRELSVSKNALFEKVQLLRTAAKQRRPAADPAPPPRHPQVERELPQESAPPAPEQPPASPQPLEHVASGETAPAALERLEVTGPDALATTGPPRPKSQLTLAAERKEKERQRQRRASARERGPQPPAADQPRSQPVPARVGSARRDAGGGGARTLWLALVALLALGGGGYYIFFTGKPAKQARPSSNQPPQMKYVTIQQTSAGVVASPDASDPENDRITYVITWFVNGKRVVDSSGPRLPTTSYQPGNRVEVEVAPVDPHGRGTAMRSQPLTIVDFAARATRPAPGGAARRSPPAPRGGGSGPFSSKR